jgi:hypothetical protein
MLFLYPGVKLGGGLVEGKVLVPVHESQHAGEGAACFAVGFVQRPEPCEVDVSVSGQRQSADRRVFLFDLLQALGHFRPGAPYGSTCHLWERLEWSRRRREAPQLATHPVHVDGLVGEGGGRLQRPCPSGFSYP